MTAQEQKLSAYLLEVTGCILREDQLKHIEKIGLEGIDWKELRKKFFAECTDNFEKDNVKYPVINLAPHDLFEWFKKELQK